MARKVGISTERVVAAAADLADREGLEAVSLATVAEIIGVRSPSLYSHVDGLVGLRRALFLRASRLLADCLDQAAGEHADPALALRAVAHQYRAFAHEHPGLYGALLPVPRMDDDPEGAAEAARSVAVTATLLTQLGVASERHVELIRMLRAMLHGFVDLELGHGFGLADPIDASFQAAVDLVVGAIEALRPADRPRW